MAPCCLHIVYLTASRVVWRRPFLPSSSLLPHRYVAVSGARQHPLREAIDATLGTPAYGVRPPLQRRRMACITSTPQTVSVVRDRRLGPASGSPGFGATPASWEGSRNATGGNLAATREPGRTRPCGLQHAQERNLRRIWKILAAHRHECRRRP